MKTIEDVLAGVDDPLQAAHEIDRRFSKDHSAQREAAMQWIEFVSRDRRPFPLGEERRTSNYLPLERSAHRLIEQATTGQEPLHGWATKAHTTEWWRGIEKEQDVYDVTLLNIIVWLWPHRGNPLSWPERMAEWSQHAAKPRRGWLGDFQSRRDDAVPVLHGALALAAHPDVAYPMVKALKGDTRLATDDYEVAVGLRRMASPEDADPRDEFTVREFGVRRLLREAGSGLAWGELRGFARKGRRDAAWLWADVDAALEVPAEWAAGVSLLLASTLRQHRGVRLLAEAVIAGEDPVAPISRVEAHVPFPDTLFEGPGWGRDVFARKLQPLSRALVGRRVWPLDALRACFPSPPTDDNREDDAFERMRELLSEACLGVALDDGVERTERVRSLDALERLAPRGDSYVKALSKLKGEDARIWDAARNAQRAIEQRYTSDSELAVRDACEILGVAMLRRKEGE
jgi:hypothetical protein